MQSSSSAPPKAPLRQTTSVSLTDARLNSRISTAAFTNAQVTIGIPTFQRPAYLLAAVTSALTQTYQNIQVIVSDNGSDVKASTVLSSLSDDRLKIHEHLKTIPIFDNWDACVALAEGDYFILLSDDDVLYPDAVQNLLLGFDGNDEIASAQIGVSYGRCRIIDGTGQLVQEGAIAPGVERATEAVLEFFDGKRPTMPCALMMRTNDIRAHGGYAKGDELGIVRDAKVWMLTALERGVVRFSDCFVADYRVHTASGTYQANVEQALSNNLALADMCASIVAESGNSGLAEQIRIASLRLNSRVFLLLIGPQERYRNNPAGVFREFLRLRKYFFSFRTVLASMHLLGIILSPRTLLRALKNK